MEHLTMEVGTKTIDGFYKIVFTGASDWGAALIVLLNGVVTGADVAGVAFDGYYSADGERLSVRLTLTVPPGVDLVQGVPRSSKPYSFRAEFTVPLTTWFASETFRVQTTYGPVNVVAQKLRNFPS